MLIEGADYFVRMVPFPPGVDGAVTPNDDGTFSIYISSNVDDQHKREALDHEIRHIELDHLYCEKPIEVIEAEADGELQPKPCKDVSSRVDAIRETDEWISSWARAMRWAEAMIAAGRTDAEYIP